MAPEHHCAAVPRSEQGGPFPEPLCPEPLLPSWGAERWWLNSLQRSPAHLCSVAYQHACEGRSSQKDREKSQMSFLLKRLSAGRKVGSEGPLLTGALRPPRVVLSPLLQAAAPPSHSSDICAALMDDGLPLLCWVDGDDRDAVTLAV